MAGENILLEVKEINKSFPGVNALTNVSFNVRKGEVHSLVGANGAGKSTLIKILAGFHKMDSGSYVLEGETLEFENPHQMIEKGISCIYQELSIVPLMDVAKNIYIGNWPVKRNLVDSKALYQGAEKILKRINLNVSPHAIAGELSIAQQQMVEIGRALTRDAKIIIMDEPTSSLTNREAETLFELIAQLKADGVSVIYISHKLDEVLRISDRITVLCDGRNVTTVGVHETDRNHLIENMLGRPLDNMFNKSTAEKKETILKVENLTRHGLFEDVSFEVKAGEIIGFFGLIGAGRSEIMKAIFGIDKLDSGSIYINGNKVSVTSSQVATKHGLALIPEDRKREGLALEQDITENMTLPILPDIKKKLFIDQKERERLTQTYVGEVSIKTPTIKQTVGYLSGGNQQKVVLAKWLMKNPKLLILDEPTRGIDVGSKADIYRIICQHAKNGVGIIVVSSELQEVLGISDRVIAVCEGRITAEFDIAEATDKKVLAAAFGGVCH